MAQRLTQGIDNPTFSKAAEFHSHERSHEIALRSVSLAS
jgi:hypothetical protein